jgi:CDP-glycerol glycerophosphotransferase (TagB/SpsB family)
MLRPIQEILLSRGDQVCWFFERDNVNHNYLKEDERLLDTAVDIFNYNPDAVLAPGNSIPSFLPGLKVAIFHGFDAGKLDRKGNNDHFKIRGCFDLYCTQGPSTTTKFKELQAIYQYFNVIETGWPALDKLFIDKPIKAKNARPVIFYGSTFSKRLTQAKNNFEQIKYLSETMDWQWLVSLHPKTTPEVLEMYRSIQSDNLRYIETDDMLPILQEADIMVGDTSSALTMFIVQNKPVVTVNNIDPKPYMLNITSADKLKFAIEKALSQPPDLMQEIANYVNQTHPYTDARSSERVVNAIDDVLAEQFPLKVKKPLNFLRNLKFRKYLNYWKFN